MGTGRDDQQELGGIADRMTVVGVAGKASLRSQCSQSSEGCSGLAVKQGTGRRALGAGEIRAGRVLPTFGGQGRLLRKRAIFGGP